MTFKDLDFKGKLQFIWDYYRLPIFGTIFFGLAAASLIYTIFIRVPEQNFCGLAVYNQFMSLDDQLAFDADLDKLVQAPEHSSVNLQNFYDDSNDVMAEANLNQKFNTYIYARELHLLLSDEENTKNFVNVEYMTPITDFLTADEIKKLDSEGKILYAKNPENGQDAPFAIDVSNSALLKKYKLYEGKKAFIGFVPMDDNTENTMKVVHALMQ